MPKKTESDLLKDLRGFVQTRRASRFPCSLCNNLIEAGLADIQKGFDEGISAGMIAEFLRSTGHDWVTRHAVEKHFKQRHFHGAK